MLKEAVLIIIGVFLVSCSSISIDLGDCENQIKQVIPNKILLESGIFTGLVNNWADGTPIGSATIHYRPGSVTGENVNYLYYDPYFDNIFPGYITYSKAIVSKDGAIVGYNSVSIRPTILQPTGNNMVSGNGLKYQEYEIVKYEVSECQFFGT